MHLARSLRAIIAAISVVMVATGLAVVPAGVAARGAVSRPVPHMVNLGDARGCPDGLSGVSDNGGGARAAGCGRLGARMARAAAAAGTGSLFTPVSPVRLMDTRNGTGGVTGPVGAAATVSLQVAGAGGVPASGVTAVVLNVTATAATASTDVAVYQDGTTRSVASNLDFTAGPTVANLVVVPLGADGKLDFFNNAGTVQIIADLSGYYTAGRGSLYTPVSPVRLMDTRNGTGGVTGPVGAAATVSLQVAGTAGVPASGVTAVVLKVTATAPTASSFVTAYPDGATRPVASSLDFASGQTVVNLVVVPLGTDGKVDFYNNSGTVQVLVDLSGYYSAPPGAPTGVSGAAASSSVVVSWQPPASSGGSAITSYTVTSAPAAGTTTVSATATSATVTGLTNGTSYRFTVTAANAIGTGPPSASSAPVTPIAPAPPAPPVITGVTARDSAVEVSWSPPATGAASLTGYVITATSGGSAATTASEPASATDAIVTGLANGTVYTFTIAAVNGNGTSPPSPPSASVSPAAATVPIAPANVQAFPQNGEVQVGWSAPPDGGSAITGYTVTVSPGGTTVSTSAATTVATVTGLTNGTAYTASVTAANLAGTSLAARAAPVTPAAAVVPMAPGNLTATATSAGQVGFQWTPPTSSGTSAITGYTVTASPGGKKVTADQCAGTPTECTAAMTGLTSSTAYTFTVTAASAAGTSAASTATSAVTPDTTVSSTPVVLSSASIAALRYVRTDGTLIFEQPPAQVTGLTAGGLVQIAPTSAAPHGFLGAVHAVTSQGGFVVVTTTAATLNDEYSSYNASLNVPFDGAASQLVAAAPGVTISHPKLGGRRLATATPQSNGASIQWSNGSVVLAMNLDLLSGDSSDSEEGEEPAVTAGPMAEIDGTVTITPILHAHISQGSMTFEVGGTVDADIKAKFGVHLSATQKVYLGQIDGPLLITEAGPVQTVFSAYLTISTDGEVGVSFDADYQHTLAAQCQISTTTADSSADTCTPVSQGSGQSGAPEAGTSIFAALDVKAGVQLGASLQLWWLAGPEVTLTPYLEISADTSANPWWDLSLGVEVGVAVTALQSWGPGETLYENDSLLTQTIADLASAGGPFSGLAITPNPVGLPAGGTQQFQAVLITAGVSTSPAVTWSVAGGPGTISSSGSYVSSQGGAAVVAATFNGMTARAGVVVSDSVPQQLLSVNGTPLVDAANVTWSPPAVKPLEYTVVVQPISPVTEEASGGEAFLVTNPAATNAYLPGLTAGLTYEVTVSMVYSKGTGPASYPIAVTPLDSLPTMLGGSGTDRDVAVDASGNPDDTGRASDGGAVVARDGSYVFYYTEASSNLAPAAIASPADDDVYLVRENLVTGATDVASVGADGKTPAPAYDAGASEPPTSFLTTNGDGSAVAYALPAASGTLAGAAYVHDFTTGTTWAVGNGVTDINLIGLSDSGTVVAYSAQPGGVTHIYRQVNGSAPQQVDKCVSLVDCTGGSMSDNGNLIVYSAPGAGGWPAIFLYDAVNGHNADLFPANTAARDTLYGALISPDGTHLVANYQSAATPADQGLVVKQISGDASTTVTSSAIRVHVPNPDGAVAVLSASADGSDFAYEAQDSVQEPAGWIGLYHNGVSETAPQLTGNLPHTAGITGDGSSVFYTMSVIGAAGQNYPGVYEWQLP